MLEPGSPAQGGREGVDPQKCEYIHGMRPRIFAGKWAVLACATCALWTPDRLPYWWFDCRCEGWWSVMATLAVTLPPEQVARLAKFLKGQAYSASGAQSITVTFDNVANSVTGPDGVARKA